MNKNETLYEIGIDGVFFKSFECIKDALTCYNENRDACVDNITLVKTVRRADGTNSYKPLLLSTNGKEINGNN